MIVHFHAELDRSDNIEMAGTRSTQAPPVTRNSASSCPVLAEGAVSHQAYLDVGDVNIKGESS